MSVKVMGLVWDTELPGNLKLLLLAYADAAEHDGTEIWPGRKRLASMCGVSVATADRLTRKLLEGGYLIQVQKGHRGRRAAFVIPLSVLAANAIVSQDATHSNADSVASSPDSVASETGKGSAHAPPPVLDPSSTPVLPIAAPPQANAWWDVTVDLFGEPTANQRSLYGRFVAMVQAGPWPPTEIRRRAGQLVELWGVKSVTVASLEKHWSRFDAQIGQVSDADVEAFTAAGDRAATLERLADE